MAISRRDGAKGPTYQVDKYGPDGRRIRRSFKRKRDALAFDKAPIDRVVEALSEQVRDITFAELAASYMSWVKTNRAEKTHLSYYHVVWPTLVPVFGTMRLSRITADMIERHKSRRAETVKAVTVNMDLTILRIMWKYAIKHGWAHVNTPYEVEKLREREPEHKAFGRNDVERILEAAQRYWVYPLVITVAHTGMRQQEAFGLLWDDVDFDEGVLYIRGAKNYANRVLNMTPQMRAALTRCRELHSGDHDHVFEFRGRRIKWGPYKTLVKIAGDVGLPRFGLHSLRHTFATHLAAVGVDGHRVQKSLGHKHYASTRRYMDYDQSGYRSANEAVEYGRSLPSLQPDGSKTGNG
jgi:integrase